VTSLKKDLTLAKRAAEFSKILTETVVTSGTAETCELEAGMSAVCDKLGRLKAANQKLYIVGNGGSAGVASHACIDFLNVAKISAFTLHEASSLTCLANDYGYENAYALYVKQVAQAGDLLIAISSSGNSANIHRACEAMKEKGGEVVTLSGFEVDNGLRQQGNLNIWVPSSDYGIVEIAHQFILHNLSDRFGAGFEE